MHNAPAIPGHYAYKGKGGEMNVRYNIVTTAWAL